MPKPTFGEVFSLVRDYLKENKGKPSVVINPGKNILFTLLFLVLVIGFIWFAFWQKSGFYSIYHWFVFVGFGFLLLLLGISGLVFNVYKWITKSNNENDNLNKK